MPILKENKNNKSVGINTFINEINKGHSFALLNIISPSEIKKSLNSNLDALYFERLYIKYDWSAFYNSETKCAYIDSKLTELLLSLNLVHELLHALSTRSVNDSGFHKNVNGNDSGRGLNEGITEYLTEEILNLDVPNDYDIEKSTYGILSNLIGSEYFIRDYIYGTNTVEKEFRNQYGDHMLELYRSAFHLLDIITVTKMNSSSTLDIASLMDMSDTLDNARASLDEVLDEMISLKLEQTNDFLDVSDLLDKVEKYPRKNNFKKFNIENEKEKYNNELDDFFNILIEQTDDITITNINAQTQNIKESIIENDVYIAANRLYREGEEK